MKITILGFEDRTYTDKTTGERKEMLQFSFSKPYKAKEGFGVSVGTETISAAKFPEQYALFMKSGEKIIGRQAVISKDVRSFKNEKYAVIDELEFI